MNDRLEIKISILAEDIERGVRLNCLTCPVARALARALRGKATCLLVKSLSASFQPLRRGQPMVCVLPAEAASFILRFDRGQKVVPTEFTLVFRPELIRQANT
jgi:hypothetical protein